MLMTSQEEEEESNFFPFPSSLWWSQHEAAMVQNGRKMGSGKNSLAVLAEHEDYPIITINEIYVCVCKCVSVT